MWLEEAKLGIPALLARIVEEMVTAVAEGRAEKMVEALLVRERRKALEEGEEARRSARDRVHDIVFAQKQRPVGGNAGGDMLGASFSSEPLTPEPLTCDPRNAPASVKRGDGGHEVTHATHASSPSGRSRQNSVHGGSPLPAHRTGKSHTQDREMGVSSSHSSFLSHGGSEIEDNGDGSTRGGRESRGGGGSTSRRMS